MSLQDHILNKLAMAIDDCVSISVKLIDDSTKSSALAASIEERDFLKIIVGEFHRQSKKTLSDKEVVDILKQLEKSEMELLIIRGLAYSPFLMCIRQFIPAQLTEDEIKNWILDNIDFSGFKNKFQAIGIVLKNFGELTDGNVVRKVIENL